MVLPPGHCGFGRENKALALLQDAQVKYSLLVFPAPRSDLVQFGSAVGTEQYSGEYRHLTDWSKSPAPVSNTLDDIECFPINDWFGVFSKIDHSEGSFHTVFLHEATSFLCGN